MLRIEKRMHACDQIQSVIRVMDIDHVWAMLLEIKCIIFGNRHIRWILVILS